MKVNRSKEASLSHELLRNTLDYNPETGIFTWKKSTAKVIKIGATAGSLDKSSGYYRVQLYGSRFLLHRLAWFYCFEEWSCDMLDHKDQNKLNNSIDNLRECDNSKNNMNRVAPITNTSGYRGVSLQKSTGKYKASYKSNGEYKYIGSYPTAEEANEAYIQAARLEFGEFFNETNVQCRLSH